MNDYENKATQLINKYFNAVPHKHTSRKLAKQLAVIAVDEIIGNIDATILYHKGSKALPINRDYWLQVRANLKAL